MKVSAMYEVESHRAFTSRMKCKKCDGTFYSIYHQTQPKCVFSWWLQCNICGHEGYASTSREAAIERWRNEN